MEARLQSARSSNANLASYNQQLERRIADLRRTKSKSGARTVRKQASERAVAASNQARELQSYASTLPQSEQRQVIAAANQLAVESQRTSSLVSQLSQMDHGVF